MSSLQTLDIAARSATTTPSPDIRHRPQVQQVAKLIDVSTCIGCKACQVACMQWNDLRDEVGTNHGTYDNPVDLTPASWTVMKFSEVEPEAGKLEWLIRKDGCMHCEDPGCLKSCPAPGAIVKYSNGIVDFISEHCVGCGNCVTGCPFDVPRISKGDNRPTSARCAPTGWAWAWSRPASRPAPPGPCTSAPRKTCTSTRPSASST
jgi:formate dehydrogenase iron-sulfur subunit